MTNWHIPAGLRKFSTTVGLALLLALAFMGVVNFFIMPPCGRMVFGQTECPVGSTSVFSQNIGLQGGTAFTTTFDVSPDANYTILAFNDNSTLVGVSTTQTLFAKTLTSASLHSALATASSTPGGLLEFENTDTTISADDGFGRIDFRSLDASTVAAGIVGRIEVLADAAFTATASSSIMAFYTSGTTGLREAMRIQASSTLLLESSIGGDPKALWISNTSNTASSSAELSLRVAGTSGGDPQIHFQVTGGGHSVIMGLDNSLSDFFVLSRATTTLGAADIIRIDTARSVIGIGEVEFPTTAPSPMLIFEGATTGSISPTGMQSQTSGLFGIDAGELRAIDVNGNVATISPHPSVFLNAISPEACEFPWAFYSANPHLGKEVYVDWCGVIKALEALTGQQFMVFNDIPKVPWTRLDPPPLWMQVRGVEPALNDWGD